jgi:hypothetical protein
MNTCRCVFSFKYSTNAKSRVSDLKNHDELDEGKKAVNISCVFSGVGAPCSQTKKNLKMFMKKSIRNMSEYFISFCINIKKIRFNKYLYNAQQKR